MASQEKDNNKIPTSNNIFSTYAAMSEDMAKLIKNVADNGLKAADLVRLKVNMKMTKTAVKQIFKGYMEINAVVAAQEANQTIDLVSSIVTDPVAFIRSTKENKVEDKDFQDKDAKSVKILDEYVKFLKILKEASEYSSGVSLVGLAKLPKLSRKAIGILISALEVIKKKAKRIEPLAVSIDKAMQTVPNTFGILTTLAYHLDQFIKISKKYKKKKIKQAVGTFFISYVFMIEEMFKLGRFLITGEYTYTDPKLFGIVKNKTTIKYKPVHLWVGIIVANKFIKLAQKLVESTVPMIKALAEIGGMKKDIANGLQALTFVFIGGTEKKKEVKGIGSIIAEAKSFSIKDAAIFLAFTSILIPIMAESVILATALTMMGQERKSIKQGIKTFKLMFDPDNVKSFISRVSTVSEYVNGKTIKDIAVFIGYLALANVAMLETVMIAENLDMLREHKKGIKKGLKALDYMMFGDTPGSIGKFFGKSSKPGLLTIISIIGSWDGLLKDTLVFIGLGILLTLSIKIYEKVAQTLFAIGTISGKMKKGIKAINYTLFGTIGPVANTEFKKKDKLGLVGIAHYLRINGVIGDALYFTLYSAILSIVFNKFQTVVDTIVDLGSNKRKAIQGIKALNIILFGKGKRYKGIIDILKDERIKELAIKDILVVGAKMVIISAVFLAVGTIISTLGILGLAAPVAMLVMMAINVVIRKMIKGLKRIKEIDFDIKAEAKKLLEMGISYIKFIQLFNFALKDVTPKDFLKTVGIIFISPLIIRMMLRGLRILDKKSKGLVIEKLSADLNTLSAAYIVFIKSVTLMGAEVKGEETFKAIAFLMISPFIIRRMVKGLRVLQKKSNGLNIPAASALIGEMSLAYVVLAKSIQIIGSTVSIGVVLTSALFFLVAPLLVRMMVWTFKVISNPRIKVLVTSGSATLTIMDAAMIGFAGSLVLLCSIIASVNMVMLIPFVALVALLGAVFATLGIFSPAILLGAVAMNIMAVALIALSFAVIVFAAAIIVFALAFQILRLIMPSDDVIEEVVNGVISMIKGVGQILRAIAANIDLGMALKGVVASVIIAGTLVLLTINALLFVVLGTICSIITPEMIQYVIDFVHAQATMAREIAANFSIKDMILALVAAAFYMVITILLTIDAIFALILYGITNIIDYTKFRKNLGLDGKNGLIPVIGDAVSCIDELIDGKAVFKSVFKLMGVMVIMATISGIAACVKGLASLEIAEYDKDGHPTGKKVKMQQSDFDTAKENIDNLVKAVVSIFYDDKGNPSETLKLIQSIKRKVVMQTIGFKMILSSISSMAKVVANMSKLVVPDEDKGFDNKGKPLGWRQLGRGDFQKFRENVSELALVITSLFDDNTNEGKAFASALDRVKISSVIKMKLMGSIIKTFGDMGTTIANMAKLMVPDTTQEGWIDKDGNITKWRQLTNGDIEEASVKITSLMTIIGTIIDKIKDTDLENVKMRTLKKFERVMGGIAPISELIDTIIKMATSQFPIIDLDSEGRPIMGKDGQPKMKYINFSQIDFPKAAANVGSIVKNYLYQLGKVLSDKYYKNRIKDINKIMEDGIAVGGISDLIDSIMKIATGQFPILDLDKSGRPIMGKDGQPKMKYVNFDATLINTATKNIGTIVKSYVDNLSAAISDDKGDTAAFAQKMANVNKVFTGSASIFSAIKPMIENVEQIGKTSENTIKIFNSNLTSIVGSYNSALEKALEKTDNYSLWDKIRDPFLDFVDISSGLYKHLSDKMIPVNLESTVNSTNKLLDKVNSMDGSKLEKMADISKNMATFAVKINGNFDGLAKAMNENIVTALDKVEQSMKDLKDFLENDFTKNLTDGVSNAVSNINVSSSGEKEPKDENIVKDKKKEQLPDNKQKENDKSKEKEIKTVQQLISALRGCINDNTINVKIK